MVLAKHVTPPPSLATSRGRHSHVRDVPAYVHVSANGRCRGLHGSNILRAIPSLPGSGRSVDASSMPLQTADAPSVPTPTCSGDPQ